MNVKLNQMVRHWPVLVVLAVYCGLVVPRIENFPPVNVDDAYQMGPIHSLLDRGSWGSDPLAGPAARWRDSHPDKKTYFQPPLYLLMAALSIKLFGWGVVQVRAVSALLGFGTIAVTYALAWELSRMRAVAVAATLVLASQPVFVHVSRQARPESAVVFFTVLAVYLVVKSRKIENKSPWIFGSGLSAGCALMSHYNGFFSVVAVGLLLVIDMNPGNIRPVWKYLRKYGQTAVKSRELRLFSVGTAVICLPFAIYVLRDSSGWFYNFRTQVSVVGRAGTFDSVWSQIAAETGRYRLFFHPYRFVAWVVPWLKLLYGSTIVFCCFRRKKWYSTPLIVMVVLLLFLAWPSPNKVEVYLAAALPYMSILIGLALADIWEWFDRRDRRLAVCYRVVAPLLVLFLLWCNVKVWRSYYNKYRDCDFDRTISELRRIIPPHAKSVMGRYSFWIGLTDYTYYRRGFRTFKDIEQISPEIIIHNDADINRPRSAELKRQLDEYLAEHGKLIGRVPGHPRGWCACGNLAVYRVKRP